MRTAGAGVIVDDLAFPDEPFFMDGPIAQAVNEVKANGVSYFSAAGNQQNDSYESGFRSSGITQNFVVGSTRSELLHDFESQRPEWIHGRGSPSLQVALLN